MGKPRRRSGACREYLDWLKEQPCVITGKRTGQWTTDPVLHGFKLIPIVVDPAHVRTKRLGGDLWNAVSLAHHLHEEQHRIGIGSFQAKYGVILEVEARRQTEQFLEEYPQFRPAA